MDNRPIGVFDSGIGGLTVVDALAKSLPNESILYVGDTARVPYGNKSKVRIQEFSNEITQWLVNQNSKIIVVACNTASSLALDHIKLKFNLPIIGVIEPGVHSAIAVTKNNRIGVLGTQATIRSDAYGSELQSINGEIDVVSQACPLFVPLAEEGWAHYPLLKPILSHVLGSEVCLVDSGEATATAVDSVLDEHYLGAEEKAGEIQCFVTDSPDSFEALAGRFVKANISAITHIDIS